MSKPVREILKTATSEGPQGDGTGPSGDWAPPQAPLPRPETRIFGVPMLKGAAQEITSIHLCPARVHLATIRDGSHLDVSNRLTLASLDLGELAQASQIAFRPRREGEEALELAVVGPPGKAELARMDLQSGNLLPGLPLSMATALQYSWDGRFVAAGNAHGRVKVWHLGAEVPRCVLEAQAASQVKSLVFHPEHPTLYATLASGALAEFTLAPSLAADLGETLRDKAPGVRFNLVSAGRHGYPIYLAGQDERVYVADTATGEVGVFSPRVGPILGLQVLPASGYLCVQGRHAVYLLHAVGPRQEDHLALICPFDKPIYAAWELDREVLLVFHAAENVQPEL